MMLHFWQLCMWPVSFPPPKPLSLWIFAPHTIVVVEHLLIKLLKLWCSLQCWKSNVFLLLFRWRFLGASNGYLPPPPQTSWCVFQERARDQNGREMATKQSTLTDQNGREMESKTMNICRCGQAGLCLWRLLWFFRSTSPPLSSQTGTAPPNIPLSCP